MFNTIKLLFTEFTGGIMSVIYWRPTGFIRDILNPIIGLVAVLCRLLGIVISISVITFLATYLSFIVASKAYLLLF